LAAVKVSVRVHVPSGRWVPCCSRVWALSVVSTTRTVPVGRLVSTTE
jgi:hypothetical protein